MKEYWKTIVPMKSEPIPEGAECRLIGGCKWHPTESILFGDHHSTELEWRVPVECVPIDVAVDAILANTQINIEQNTDLVKIGGEFLRATTQRKLRELVTAKLIELAEQESKSGTH